MPNDTVWPLEPHTQAKHSILRRYLQGYYPKMASVQQRLVFIDGFAGPGQYQGGEPGSPVIALDALTRHNQFPRWSGTKFPFLFIEEERSRFDLLNTTLASRQDPANVSVSVLCGTFEEHMTEVLRDLGSDRLAPAFVMIDPFGVKGLPLELLRRLAAFPKTELLISFMYESISRFHAQPNYEAALDELFGTPAWREAEGLEGDAKKAFLSNLYASQLAEIGMEYVRLFEMRDGGNRTEYFLAFATHHPDGLRVMKDALWNLDQSGGVEFSDFTAPSPDQGTLFEAEPNYVQLRQLIVDRFAGRRSVPIEEVNRFVLLETAFRETHGKTVLREDEAAGSVVIHRPSGRRKNYLNEGTVVTFPLL